MDDIRFPNELLPTGIKAPGAFIVDKQPDLPDYGVDTGDLVIVDRDAEFAEGALSVFVKNKTNRDTNPHPYRVSREKVKGYKYFGKVAMVMKYYGNSPHIS